MPGPVIQKDGLLFYRRPGQPDTPVPCAPEHYSVFLRSAKEKHGLTSVVGPNGQEAPCLPEEPALPKLRRERLSSGEEVYRLVSSVHEPFVQKPSGDTQNEQAGVPTGEKTVNVAVWSPAEWIWSSGRFYAGYRNVPIRMDPLPSLDGIFAPKGAGHDPMAGFITMIQLPSSCGCGNWRQRLPGRRLTGPGGRRWRSAIQKEQESGKRRRRRCDVA